MIGLGGIVYRSEAGSFVFVDNVHHQMQAKLGILTWKSHLHFWSGHDYLKYTPTEVIFNQTGKAYERRRQVHFSVCFCLFIYCRLFPLAIPAYVCMDINLSYDNLNKSHAWKRLQNHAR